MVKYGKHVRPHNQGLQVILPNKYITEINRQQGFNCEGLKNPLLQQKLESIFSTQMIDI